MRDCLAAVLAATMLFPQAAGAQGSAERGEYLVTIMECGGCHTPRGEDGEPIMDRYLGGATIGFEMPGLGIFWPPNLTNHATGLADWTDEQIIAAIRQGVRPDGRQLVPAMPYMNYAALTDEDVADVVAYLRTLPGHEWTNPGPIGDGEPASAPFYRVMPPS